MSRVLLNIQDVEAFCPLIHHFLHSLNYLPQLFLCVCGFFLNIKKYIRHLQCISHHFNTQCKSCPYISPTPICCLNFTTISCGIYTSVVCGIELEAVVEVPWPLNHLWRYGFSEHSSSSPIHFTSFFSGGTHLYWAILTPKDHTKSCLK